MESPATREVCTKQESVEAKRASYTTMHGIPLSTFFLVFPPAFEWHFVHSQLFKLHSGLNAKLGNLLHPVSHPTTQFGVLPTEQSHQQMRIGELDKAQMAAQIGCTFWAFLGAEWLPPNLVPSATPRYALPFGPIASWRSGCSIHPTC